MAKNSTNILPMSRIAPFFTIFLFILCAPQPFDFTPFPVYNLVSIEKSPLSPGGVNGKSFAREGVAAG